MKDWYIGGCSDDGSHVDIRQHGRTTLVCMGVPRRAAEVVSEEHNREIAALARPPVAPDDDEVRRAARRLLDPSCLAGGYDDDLEIVAQAALVAGEDVARLRAALIALLRFCELHEREAIVMQAPSWYVAMVPNPIEQAREALAASGTAPRPEHQFLPRSGSQTASGVYTRCGVNGCDLAPEQHTAPPPTCDACGLPITEDYVETLVEGDTGEYHVACVPPGLPMRTVLIS